jgi:hypothetical protein
VGIKNPEALKPAWELTHSHLKENMMDKWLSIVDMAIQGLEQQAIIALEKVKAIVKSVCKANKEFMEDIRKLGDEYYPGILGFIFAGAASGAAMGGGSGAVVGGPIGAGLGAAVGMTAGAIAGFFGAGWNAVYIHKHQKDKQM